MDPAGCAPGLATDGAFDHPQTACGASLAAFWAVTGALLAVKLLAVLMLVSTARRKRRALAQGGGALHAARAERTSDNAGWPGRLSGGSLRIVLEASGFAVLLVTVVAVGLGAAGAKNAASWVLFTLAFLPYAVGKSIAAVRAVRLSRRILPPQVRDSPLAALVEKLDAASVFMFVGLVSTTVASQIVLVIAAPLALGAETALVQAGLVMKGVFTVTYQLMHAWQLVRCMRVIEQHDRYLQDGTVALVPEARLRSREQMRVALVRLRRGCALHLVFLPGALYFWVLASRVVPWTWWTIVIIFAFESVSGFTAALLVGGRASAWSAVSAGVCRWRFAEASSGGSRPPAERGSASLWRAPKPTTTAPAAAGSPGLKDDALASGPRAARVFWAWPGWTSSPPHSAGLASVAGDALVSGSDVGSQALGSILRNEGGARLETISESRGGGGGGGGGGAGGSTSERSQEV